MLEWERSPLLMCVNSWLIPSWYPVSLGGGSFRTLRTQEPSCQALFPGPQRCERTALQQHTSATTKGSPLAASLLTTVTYIRRTTHRIEQLFPPIVFLGCSITGTGRNNAMQFLNKSPVACWVCILTRTESQFEVGNLVLNSNCQSLERQPHYYDYYDSFPIS